jgi:hypothetical protein
VHSLAFHALAWIVLAVLAVLCLRRAWISGEGGYDDIGNIRRPWHHITKVQPWGALGIGFVAFILLDLFFLFSPQPASLR